jgi:hypothetical protein
MHVYQVELYLEYGLVYVVLFVTSALDCPVIYKSKILCMLTVCFQYVYAV